MMTRLRGRVPAVASVHSDVLHELKDRYGHSAMITLPIHARLDLRLALS